MGKESRGFFFGSWLGAFDFCESRAHLSRFQFVDVLFYLFYYRDEGNTIL